MYTYIVPLLTTKWKQSVCFNNWYQYFLSKTIASFLKKYEQIHNTLRHSWGRKSDFVLVWWFQKKKSDYCSWDKKRELLLSFQREVT